MRKLDSRNFNEPEAFSHLVKLINFYIIYLNNKSYISNIMDNIRDALFILGIFHCLSEKLSQMYVLVIGTSLIREKPPSQGV